MNKAYLIAPLVALLVFAGFFTQFKSGYQARENAHDELVQSDKKAKLAAELAARRQALDDAMRIQAERKKEREAREAEERARKDARQVALDARDKAFHDQEDAIKQADSFQKDIDADQDAMAKLTGDRKSSLDELAFLQTYIEKAKANVRALQDVLVKIDAAEQARQAAAEAAKKATT